MPIPALYDAEGKPHMTTETLDHAISVMAEKGTDHWWSGPLEDFIPSSLEGQWSRGRDTLDVWFDSGSSWTMLDQRPDLSEPLADVYLEGSDQHRGWFQSSLLTSLTKTDSAPFRHLITHGFVLDEEGQKMSKSASNGISPMDVVMGTKVRRSSEIPS